MAVLLTRKARVVVQGITGHQGTFHTRAMLDFGTKVVAGGTPGKAGSKVEGVPVFEIRQAAGTTDMLIRTPDLGRALARTLGDKSAALMRGHGAAVAAASLHLVVGKAYYLNLNARLQLQAMQLSGDKVTFLDPEEAKKAAQDYERSWDFWKSKLPGK